LRGRVAGVNFGVVAGASFDDFSMQSEGGEMIAPYRRSVSQVHRPYGPAALSQLMRVAAGRHISAESTFASLHQHWRRSHNSTDEIHTESCMDVQPGRTGTLQRREHDIRAFGKQLF